MDNIVVERIWTSVKCEEVYLKAISSLTIMHDPIRALTEEPLMNFIGVPYQTEGDSMNTQLELKSHVQLSQTIFLYVTGFSRKAHLLHMLINPKIAFARGSLFFDFSAMSRNQNN